VDEVSATPRAFDRHVDFDGCYNFRDLGGYETIDGRSVRTGRLFRADGPHALTDRDEATLRNLGLRTIIDLRTTSEASERGTYAERVDGDVVVVSLPMMDVLPDRDDYPTWVDPEVVARRYVAMLRDGHTTIAACLAVLGDPQAYPVLFHCSAGKDRTGILAAVLLAAVGVPDDTIIADYALSHSAMQRLLAHMRNAYPDAHEQLARAAPAMLAAEPATMRTFLTLLRTEYGSIDDYLDTLGVPQTMTQRLRTELLT
jgi:protein tyrosine/serine phosphatase